MTNILAAATVVMTWLICYNAQWVKTEILSIEERVYIWFDFGYKIYKVSKEVFLKKPQYFFGANNPQP